jgi:hypothetical protein
MVEEQKASVNIFARGDRCMSGKSESEFTELENFPNEKEREQFC